MTKTVEMDAKNQKLTTGLYAYSCDINESIELLRRNQCEWKRTRASYFESIS
jgi:hypothetical protein